MMAPRNSRTAAGFSLVEFMVAMLLGAILIGGAVSIYLASLRSYTESERSMGIGEGGRFALLLMNDALRHAGFMGGIQGFDVVEAPTLGPAGGENCDGAAAPYNLDVTLVGDVVNTAGVVGAFACITDGVPGTDALVAKYLIPDPISDDNPDDPNDSPDGRLGWGGPAARTLDDEMVYVVTNGEGGLLIDGADPNLPRVGAGEEYANASAFPYQYQVFYVRDLDPDPKVVNPWLARKILRWDAASSGMAVVTENLVEGVEQLRFRYGFDTDLDGLADTFGNESQVTDWSRVSVVEPFVLVRSRDVDYAYTDEKTYQLADVPFTPFRVTDPTLEGAIGDDRYIRLLISSSISVRNPYLFMTNGS